MPHASPARGAPQFPVSKEFSPPLRRRPPAADDGLTELDRPDKAELLQAARARGTRDELREQYKACTEKEVALFGQGQAAGAGGAQDPRTLGLAAVSTGRRHFCGWEM
jgi:hypothetical protein